jgi:hypothetical protein
VISYQLREVKVSIKLLNSFSFPLNPFFFCLFLNIQENRKWQENTKTETVAKIEGKQADLAYESTLVT